MCWYRHGHLYSYLFHLRVTCKIVSFVVQPHGFFNCSPAVDVPPNTCEIDTKENDVKDNGVPKPTSVGLMAKIWRYSHKTPFILVFCCRTFTLSLLNPGARVCTLFDLAYLTLLGHYLFCQLNFFNIYVVYDLCVK